ncbi:MAG: type II secretion system protein [Candidatus Marithrix sp.]|nr:type II secretion system protein [Candidatus Marithrix sp.]
MKKNNGFTLLEVLIALTIVGMALGTVYSLLAGSKRLAFKATDDIERTIFLRSALNAAQILEEPEYPELPNRYKKSLEIESGDLLEKPEKQTRPMRLALEAYSLHDEEKGIEFNTVRLILMDVAK